LTHCRPPAFVDTLPPIEESEAGRGRGIEQDVFGYFSLDVRGDGTGLGHAGHALWVNLHRLHALHIDDDGVVLFGNDVDAQAGALSAYQNAKFALVGEPDYGRNLVHIFGDDHCCGQIA